MFKTRALVIYSGWMGDFMWFVPFLKALAKSGKFKSLSAMVKEQQFPLADSLTLDTDLEEKILDSIYVDKPWQRPFAGFQALACWGGIGTYIDITGRFKAALRIPPQPLSRKIMIPNRKDAKEFALLKGIHWFAKEMSPRNKQGHMVDSYLSLLEDFGIDDYEIDFRLHYDEKTIKRAKRIISENGLEESDSVVLNLGSAQFSKIWPSEKFKQLALELKASGINVVIMGANNYRWNKNYDRKAVEADFEVDYDGLVLVKNIPTMVNAYLLSSGAFNVSVGNDSFANHMAGSASEVPEGTPGAVMDERGRWFKAPTLAVNTGGGTQEKFCGVYDPTGKFHVVVRTKKDYSQFECLGKPCEYDQVQHVCRHFGKVPEAGQSPCISRITVKQMYEATMERLKASKEAA